MGGGGRREQADRLKGREFRWMGRGIGGWGCWWLDRGREVGELWWMDGAGGGGGSLVDGWRHWRVGGGEREEMLPIQEMWYAFWGCDFAQVSETSCV